MLFKVSKPCLLTFESNIPVSFVSIMNDTGNIVYGRRFTAPHLKFKVNFNKIGTYKVASNTPDNINVINVEKPHQYKGFDMPNKQWDKAKEVSRVIRLDYQSNSSPAFIKTSTGVIYLNPSFFTFPAYIQEFIFEHEKGHLKYMSEHFCDLYAVNEILKRGGNLSSCILALQTALKRTPNNIQRTEQLFSKLITQ
jgi:hypothetical protein